MNSPSLGNNFIFFDPFFNPYWRQDDEVQQGIDDHFVGISPNNNEIQDRSLLNDGILSPISDWINPSLKETLTNATEAPQLEVSNNNNQEGPIPPIDHQAQEQHPQKIEMPIEVPPPVLLPQPIVDKTPRPDMMVMKPSMGTNSSQDKKAMEHYMGTFNFKPSKTRKKSRLTETLKHEINNITAKNSLLKQDVETLQEKMKGEYSDKTLTMKYCENIITLQNLLNTQLTSLAKEIQK